MTTENIHLNSFMFEPILDISDHHLKSYIIDVLELILIAEELTSASNEAAKLDLKVFKKGYFYLLVLY